jgi:IclR family KDG regulon transcriptional repressor
VPVTGKIKQSDRHVEAVLAAADILDSFLQFPTQTLKQIIDRTRFTRNRVMRLAGTLEARGYLLRDFQARTYTLGPRIMSLGRVYERQSNLAGLARPTLQELARSTGESASIYVLDGLDRVVLAREEGTKDIRLSVTEGQRMPVHAGASGKVLLAFGPPEVRNKVLSRRRLIKLAPGTITDSAKLAPELHQVRARGYALSLGERVADAGAIAAPIFGPENRFLGALGVAGPIHRFTPETLQGRTKLVLTAAAELSRKLGG